MKKKDPINALIDIKSSIGIIDVEPLSEIGLKESQEEKAAAKKEVDDLIAKIYEEWDKE